MSDDNPFLDDRDRQASLFGDTDATRTMDRSGGTVTGSDSFVDDRDGDGMDAGEQAGLFTQTEDMDDQAAIGGGTASQTEEGFFGDGGGGGGSNAPPAGALETAIDTFAAETPDKTPAVRRSVDPGDLGARVEGDPTPLLQTATDRRLFRGAVRGREGFRQVARDKGGEGRVGEIESAFVGFTQDQFGGNTGDDSNRQAAAPALVRRASAEPAVSLFDRGTSGGDSSRPPAGDVLDSGPGPTAEMVGTGLAPGDTRIAQETERQSRRRRTGDRPDDLAEQLAAQRAAPTVTRPAATPAASLFDTGGEQTDDDNPLLIDQEIDSDGEMGFVEDQDSDRMQAGDGSREQRGMMGGDTTTETLEFERRELANAVRDDLPAGALAETDDRRRTTVQVDASALSDRQLNRLAGQAADAGSFEDDKTGQVPLTEAERSRIDFTETTVPEARAAKGVFAAEGVDDFVSFFDETLTVDENRDIASRASRDEQGKQMDAGDTTRQRAARAFRSAEQNRLGNIVTGAKRGSDDAVDALVDEVGSDEDAVNVLMAEGGVSESQARGIIGLADTPAQRDALVETNLIRLRSSGRFNSDPTVDAPAAPGQRAPANGRFVGTPSNIIRPPDPGAEIKRDPQSGQFVISEGERGDSGPPFGPVDETQVQRGNIR